ncbi:MAG: sigma-70 family RNA polymerase sigma factor, partial [Oscillospiraceae bacterium]
QFVHDSALAEDLTQETFLSAYTHLDTAPENAMKPWLARIATNKAKDYLRSAYNRRVEANDEPCDCQRAKPVTNMSQAQPEDIYISNEGANRVRDEIYALKEPYLKVSVLFFLEEKTIDEIAEILKRPPKTVHTQLYRAKNILKTALEVT